MGRKPLTRPWTAQEDAFVAKLLREGKDYHYIARRLKRSAHAVRTRADTFISKPQAPELRDQRKDPRR
jgi:hypothetical protein